MYLLTVFFRVFGLGISVLLIATLLLRTDLYVSVASTVFGFFTDKRISGVHLAAANIFLILSVFFVGSLLFNYGRLLLKVHQQLLEEQQKKIDSYDVENWGRKDKFFPKIDLPSRWAKATNSNGTRVERKPYKKNRRARNVYKTESVNSLREHDSNTPANAHADAFVPNQEST